MRSLAQYERKVTLSHVHISRGVGSMSLLDHSPSGANAVGVLGRTQAFVDVNRALSVLPVAFMSSLWRESMVEVWETP